MLEIIKHPIVEHHLTILRDAQTSNAEFRHSGDVISHFLAAAAFNGLPLKAKDITTPMEKFTGSEVDCDIVFVPVLRAGLALLDYFKFLLPSAKISFVGLRRNEVDFNASEYYFSAPQFFDHTQFIILEMMIATGGSVTSAIRRLRQEGVRNFTVCTIIAAPEGIEIIQNEFPEVRIITASLDRELNSKRYILPGLGDAGDRWCGV